MPYLHLALLCSYCLLSTAYSKFFLCSVHRFRGRWTVVQKSKYDKTATSSTCRNFNVFHSLVLKKKVYANYWFIYWTKKDTNMWNKSLARIDVSPSQITVESCFMAHSLAFVMEHVTRRWKMDNLSLFSLEI